ncbi:Tetratricopeptide repeat [Paraliobacillus sp. PM-2]|uniref:tetratricopeptide repeat protein n=1 Tax=Paraliobacillus sp. PM-2 TaxID=1462524 RepID=UPI00061CAB5A|nr:tetratricopeptide repeat protein [Paraliobacillus sp. PM-2]CQR46561.1 Tetratricopeptide repeat [Paraliobacillus sp. PM-2]
MNQKEIHSLRKELKKALYENNMQQAKPIAEQLEAQYDGKATGDNESTQVIIAATLAKYYQKMKNYDKSAHYSRQAIHIANIEKMALTSTLIEVHLNYAKLEKEYKQYTNARKLLATLLQKLEKSKWEDNFAYGLTYRLLAKVGFEDMTFDAVVNQLNQALGYFRKDVDEDHPIIYQTIDDLTETHIRMESYQEALEMQEYLLQVYQETDDLLLPATILLRIGEIYFYIDLKKARKTVTQALDLLQSLEKTALLYESKGNLLLAELDENLANYPRAITYYKRSLDQLRQVHETEHFMIVYAYSKIGTLHMKVNQLKEAKQYLEEGIKLTENHPRIRMQFLYALGKIYSNEKSYDHALAMYHAFLDQLEQEDKKLSKAYADTLQSIAFNFIQQDNVDQAFEYYQAAISIYQKVKPISNEELGFASIRLAYCYENKAIKEIEKANEWYEYGVGKVEKVRDKSLTEEALASIIDFYQRHDFPKKQPLYENKLVKLQLAKSK